MEKSVMKDNANKLITFPYKSVLEVSLDDALLEKARKELNETEENIRNGKDYLKRFLIKNNLTVDESDLLMILRAKKFRNQDCIDQLKKVLKSLRIVKRAYNFIDAENVKGIFENNIIGMLPYRDEEGAAIAYVRSGIWLDQGFTAKQLYQACIVFGFYLCQQPISQVAGINVILDMQGLSLREFRITLDEFKTVMPAMRGFAARIKKVFIINESAFSRFVYQCIKYLLPRKITSRISVHSSNLETLHQELSSELLPEEFGGSLGPISNKLWIDRVEKAVESLNSTIKKYDSAVNF